MAENAGDACRPRERVCGGINTIAVDDPDILEMAGHSLNHLDSQSEHSTRYKVLEILNASKQVVAGMSYRIRAKIALSDSPKGEDKSLEEAAVLSGTEPRICNFKVWHRPWIPLPEGRQIELSFEDDK